MSDSSNPDQGSEDQKSETTEQAEAAAEQASADTPTDSEPLKSETPKEDTASKADPTVDQFPPANFVSIISMLTSQAMVAMGHMPHPATGQPQPNLNEAKYLVDLLAMLEEKTKGNLDEEEKKMMDEVLHQLRLGFVAAQNQPKN